MRAFPPVLSIDLRDSTRATRFFTTPFAGHFHFADFHFHLPTLKPK